MSDHQLRERERRVSDDPGRGRGLRRARAQQGLCPWCGEDEHYNEGFLSADCPHFYQTAVLRNFEAMLEAYPVGEWPEDLLDRSLFPDGLDGLRRRKAAGQKPAHAVAEELLAMAQGLL